MGYVVVWLIVIIFVVYEQVRKQNQNAKTGGRGLPGGQGTGRGGVGNQPVNGYGRQTGYPGNAAGGAQTYGRPAAGGAQAYGRPVAGGAQTYGRPGEDALRQKQQELKNRLQQRYGSPQQAVSGQQGYRQGGAGQGNGQVYGGPGKAAPGKQPGRNGQRASDRQGRPGDILSRAAANVRENETDQMELLMNAPGGLIGGMTEYGGLSGVIDIGASSELMREISDLMIMGYQAEPVSTRDFIAEGVEMLGRYEVPGETCL